MAYTDDSVKAKLSALNETQESIVTVAQWIMFHRRHADRTAQLWMQRLRDSSASKRLNLIYLANEVIQQSKARRKNEFAVAFAPIIVEASATAFKGAAYEVQQKLRRVIEVWRQRQIFDVSLQDGIEARIDEIDKSRGSGKKQALGGSLFSNSSSSAPPELQPLVPLQTSVSKAEIAAKSTLATATSEYEKLTDPSNPVPSPPVHAARLSAVLKSLANAEGAVAESIKARQALVEGLEKLLTTNRNALAEEESAHAKVVLQRATAEHKKREVEDGIMRGLSEEATPADFGGSSNASTAMPHQSSMPMQLERPAIESLTPPPIESLTPVDSPRAMDSSNALADMLATEQGITVSTDSNPTGDVIPTVASVNASAPTAVAPPPPVALGADLLSSLNTPHVRPRSEDSSVNGDGGEHGPGSSVKRRRITKGGDGDELPEFTAGDAMDGLDDEVAAMLGRE